MAFLALASQKSVLTLQKNFYQLQLVSNLNESRYYQELARAIETADPDGYDTNSQWIMYNAMDEELDTEKESIENQLTAIEAEISSLKTLVNNSIKSSCQLNISGGS
ncbi:hypothetical protein IJ579_01195 [bacterium]|nr:hypothetical protein [bacterium]